MMNCVLIGHDLDMSVTQCTDVARVHTTLVHIRIRKSLMSCFQNFVSSGRDISAYTEFGSYGQWPSSRATVGRVQMVANYAISR